MSPDMTSSAQAARPERFGSAYRGVGSHGNGTPEDGEQHNGTGGYEPVDDKPRLPSFDLAAPQEPVLTPDSWLDSPTGNLADHPLLRGLLLELPPKGSTPPAGWLDRWFEATRSILELLYVQEGTRDR